MTNQIKVGMACPTLQFVKTGVRYIGKACVNQLFSEGQMNQSSALRQSTLQYKIENKDSPPSIPPYCSLSIRGHLGALGTVSMATVTADEASVLRQGCERSATLVSCGALVCLIPPRSFLQ